jgi:hypothetical protein
LTVFPKQWSIRKIQQEFNASNDMVWIAKKLVADKGTSSNPNTKLGKVLPPATGEIVKQFHASHEISTFVDGPKAFSINSKGKKVYLQRQLLLCNLKEAY